MKAQTSNGTLSKAQMKERDNWIRARMPSNLNPDARLKEWSRLEEQWYQTFHPCHGDTFLGVLNVGHR